MGTRLCNDSGEIEGDLGVVETEGDLIAGIFNSSVDYIVLPLVILLLTVCLPLACSTDAST